MKVNLIVQGTQRDWLGICVKATESHSILFNTAFIFQLQQKNRTLPQWFPLGSKKKKPTWDLHTFNPQILRIRFQFCSRQSKRKDDQRNKTNHDHFSTMPLGNTTKFSENTLNCRAHEQSFPITSGMALENNIKFIYQPFRMYQREFF